MWMPAFRLAVARRTAPGPPVDLDAPVILADKVERGRVIDASLTAAALGVRRGMTLVQAQAVAHDARTVIDDAPASVRTWSAVLDALDAASPVVEDDGLGRAFLDMQGEPPRAIAAVHAALAALDLPVRAAYGPNRFVAACAAHRGDGAVCAGDPAAFVAPFALELLEIDPAVIERLRLLGVTTLGELAALPHGPFVRRFGADAAVWHARARGRDDRPLRPRPRATRIDRTLYGEGEATSEEQVLFALRTLVGRVVEDLAAAGARAGRLVLGLECEDGGTRTLVTRVAQPTCVTATLFSLLRARLEGVTLEAAVTGLRLAAEDLVAGGVTLSLFAAADPDPDALGVVLARLDAAFGEGHALRARITSGPRIERRYVLEPFTLAPLATSPAASAAAAPAPLAERASMQLRVIEPQPVDVRIMDGVPRMIGSPPQAVVEYAGPWRVDENWWSSAFTRDEYDVCLDDGSLLRLACEGDAWSVRGIYD